MSLSLGAVSSSRVGVDDPGVSLVQGCPGGLAEDGCRPEDLIWRCHQDWQVLARSSAMSGSMPET
jgi:hypothetical protein